MEDFSGKTVAITGGATGIGFSFAKRFGAEGAKIAIGANNMERVKQSVSELEALGIEAKGFECDVTRRKDVEKFADGAWAAFGTVDVVINNAGIMGPFKRIIDLPVEAAKQILDVNFYGVFHGSAVFAKRFIEQGTPAAIYNLGSENSHFNGTPRAAAYVASKHAVLGFTDSLRSEMPLFIDVGLICPGFVKTELGEGDSMKDAMDVDRFTAIAMEQIKAGKYYIVSHAYNIEHINKRYNEVSDAYTSYAPRYDGDAEFDIQSKFAAYLASKS